MGRYALAGALVVAGSIYLWQTSPEPALSELAESDFTAGVPAPVNEKSIDSKSNAITRQEAKLLSSAALDEPATPTLADDSVATEIDADAIPLASQKQPRALGVDLDAEDLFGIPDRLPKALGPDLDPEDLSMVVSRAPQRLGEDIDVEAYEAMLSKRAPQSLGDDIDVGDQNPQ